MYVRIAKNKHLMLFSIAEVPLPTVIRLSSAMEIDRRYVNTIRSRE
jgi:hypothetical protein